MTLKTPHWVRVSVNFKGFLFWGNVATVDIELVLNNILFLDSSLKNEQLNNMQYAWTGIKKYSVFLDFHGGLVCGWDEWHFIRFIPET